MKILLDCVVTAEPGKCSTTVQFLTFVKRTLEERDDVFFYWLIPDWVTAEDRETVFPQHPNVRYIDVPQHKDRTKEYLTLRKEFDLALAFNGELWDFDVLVTVRTGLVPLMKLLATSPRHASLSWLKQIWLIEEMPLMDFKKTVMTIDADTQDLFTLQGYLTADRVYILSYHEKPMILQRAREFLTPSRVRAIDAKIKPVVTSQFYDFRLKSGDDLFVPGTGKPFGIAYAGRMDKGAQLDEINDMMLRQFIMKGDKVHLLACTQSKTYKSFSPEFVDIRFAKRDEFWGLAKTNMHVIVKMDVEGGFNLSLLEPMMLGVPALVYRAEWSEALLGSDYPFFIRSSKDAYAFVSAFYEDYAGMYGRFVAWHQDVFVPLFTRRFEHDLLYTHLGEDIEAFAGVLDRYASSRPGKKENRFVLDMLEHVGDAGEMVIADVVAELVDAGKVDKTMLEKLRPEDRDARGLVWSTGWNEFRVMLKAFHGWTDASTRVGHLRRAA